MDESFDDDMPIEPSEAMAEFISQFLNEANGEQTYRQHYCDLVASRVWNDFGIDGMCELMMAMDRKAEWISDIIIESSDLENIMFKKYGTWDSQLAKKARSTKSMQELNEKLWRLRRKYAKLIVDEIIQTEANA